MQNTDYELIKDYQENGNDIAFEILFRRHKTLLNIYAQKMYVCFRKYDGSKDFNHHFSELSLAFYQAVKTVNLEKMGSNTLLKKRLHFYMRNYNQKLHNYFNAKGRRVNFREFNDGSDICYEIHEPVSQAVRIEGKIALDNLIEAAKVELNKTELRVFNMILDNQSVMEIAKYIRRSKQQIHNIKDRIARKLRKYR